MIEKKAIVHDLLNILNKENNFLMILREKSELNQDEFLLTKRLFEAYISSVEGSKLVDRRLARFMLDILTTLEGTVYQLSLTSKPDTKAINNAHAEMLELAYKLLP